MAVAYILLGTDLGDREKNLGAGRKAMEQAGLIITQASRIYESASWGFESNTLFLNQVVAVRTTDTPRQVLQTCLNIERKLGRIRSNTGAYTSRIIDLDILLFDEMQVDTQELTIPHPQLPNRLFALLPLAELAPDYVHPCGKTIAELVTNSPDSIQPTPLVSAV